MAGRYRGVTRRGNGWQISFTLPFGERCREIVRSPNTRKGEDEAAAIRGDIITAIDRGQFDYPSFFPRSRKAIKYSCQPGDHILVREALDDFLRDAQRRCAYSTYRDYLSRTRRHLIPAFGELSLSELRADHVRSWIGRAPGSAKSINNALIPLRRVFRMAYLEEKYLGTRSNWFLGFQ